MKTVDEYLQTVTPAQKVSLQRVRMIVKRTVPESVESISYGMPTFKYQGKVILLCAAFKNHMSLFGDIGPIEKKLETFKVSHKGTVQFTEQNPVPEAIIEEILRMQVSKIAKINKVSKIATATKTKTNAA